MTFLLRRAAIAYNNRVRKTQKVLVFPQSNLVLVLNSWTSFCLSDRKRYRRVKLKWMFSFISAMRIKTINRHVCDNIQNLLSNFSRHLRLGILRGVNLKYVRRQLNLFYWSIQFLQTCLQRITDVCGVFTGVQANWSPGMPPSISNDS